MFHQDFLNANLKNLSNNLGNSTDPQIALYQNNVYVIWTDQSTGNGDIYFKRSIDNGTTFGSIENLSNNPGNFTSPIITVSQSAVYIIWTDQSTGNGDIYFKRSIDNGTTFGSVNNLSNNTGSSSSPQIAASGSNLYTIWVDTSSGSSEIYYRQSLDQGSEFTGIKILSKTRSVDGEHASAPKIYASVFLPNNSFSFAISLRNSFDFNANSVSKQSHLSFTTLVHINLL